MDTRNLYSVMDESASDAAFVVAGFIGTVDQWNQFDMLWRPCCETPFHATEFFTRDNKGQRTKRYRGWSDERGNQYYEQLLGAIENSRLIPIGSVVDVAAFNALPVEERHHLTGGHWSEQKIRSSGAPSKPYYLAFQDALASSLNAAESRGDYGVHFTFDEQHDLERHAINVYDRIKRAAETLMPDSARRMAGLAYESDEQNIGLQAADLLCYAWSRFATHGHDMRADVHRVFQMLKRMPNSDSLHYFSRDTLRRLLDKAPMETGRVYEPQHGIGRDPLGG